MKAGFPRAAAVYMQWRDLSRYARAFHPLPLPSGHPCPPARRRAADPRAGGEGVMMGGVGTSVHGGATAGCFSDYVSGFFFWVMRPMRVAGGAHVGTPPPCGGGGARTRLHFRGGSPATPGEVSARARFDNLLRYTI